MKIKHLFEVEIKSLERSLRSKINRVIDQNSDDVAWDVHFIKFPANADKAKSIYYIRLPTPRNPRFYIERKVNEILEKKLDKINDDFKYLEGGAGPWNNSAVITVNKVIECILELGYTFEGIITIDQIADYEIEYVNVRKRLDSTGNI